MAVVGPVGAGKVNCSTGVHVLKCSHFIVLAVQLTPMYAERATCIEGSCDSAR